MRCVRIPTGGKAMVETIIQKEKVKKEIRDGLAFVGIFTLFLMATLVLISDRGDAWIKFLSSSGFFNVVFRFTLSAFLFGVVWGTLTTVVEALESRDEIAYLNRMLHESWDEIRKLRGC